MTFVRKFNGKEAAPNEPIVAVYTCPLHGEFDAKVRRLENGEAPDSIQCGDDVEAGTTTHPLTGGPAIVFERCELEAAWTPSPTVACRVRRIEVVRGKWEKPERKTYLDTRKLGEGQDIEEFQAERKNVWTEQRRRRVKELLR